MVGDGRRTAGSRRRRSTAAQPDIVLLDLDMPEIDGISSAAAAAAKAPGYQVIVVSTLTQRNAEISLKCLSLGALDYLPKPDGAPARSRPRSASGRS